jgi:hypothetical protein
MPPVDVDHLPDWLARLTPSAPRLEETVAALGRLLRDQPVAALGRLDAGARRWSRWDDVGWRSLQPDDVRQLVSATDDPLAVDNSTP